MSDNKKTPKKPTTPVKPLGDRVNLNDTRFRTPPPPKKKG